MTRKILAVSALVLFLLLVAVGVSAQDLDPRAGAPSLEGTFAPDQLLIRFRSSVTNRSANRVLARRSVSHIRRIKGIDVEVVRLPPGLSVEQAVEIFRRLPEVEFVEPNYLLWAQAPEKAEIDDQWGLQMIQAVAAWGEIDVRNPVLMGIVDTGIYRDHTDLADNIWANPGETLNGVDDDGNGYIDDVWGWDFSNGDNDPSDDNKHGTVVSSVAAGIQDGSGVVGVCPWCQLMSVKVLGANGSATLDVVADGIIYAADNGARVINLSLGGPSGSSTLESAVNHAWNEGAVVVAAAGNDGAETLFYPAAYDNAMAIASTNEDDYRSCFSNYSDDFISVAAPGEEITGAMPDGGYATFSGTSLAAPHVSGLAGLLFSQDPGRSNSDVRNLIETTVNDLGPVGTDDYFGTGRINAHRAVMGDNSPTAPPTGLFVDDPTATGYANSRKLVRDASDNLHFVWHSRSGGQYRVLYMSSSDGGANWSAPQVVFESSAETFHPALAMDASNIYVAFPSMDGSANYQVFFTRKPLVGGNWSTPVPVMSGAYHAVRPDLYVDPSNGRLHLAASSFDDAPYFYYASSSDSGQSWSQVGQVNVDLTGGDNTRYVDVHAHGSNVYVAGRLVKIGDWFPEFRTFAIHSSDGGAAWMDLAELASATGWFPTEYGVSMAGAGDVLYLGYEDDGEILFRSSDGGAVWSDAENIGAGIWPSVTYGKDDEVWLTWVSDGDLWLRHHTGSAWEAAEIAGQGGYPSLKLGTGATLVEWAATHCSGAPFRLVFGARDETAPPIPVPQPGPPVVSIVSPGEGSVVAGTVTVQIVAVDAEDELGALTVEWRVDGGVWQAATYNASSGQYEETWDTTLEGEGMHVVHARATDSTAETGETSNNVHVNNVNDAPVAGITYSCPDMTCDFDGSGSTDIDGTIESYSWDFGDSNTASGVMASHTYDSGGTYTVVLTVTDDGDATGTDSQTLPLTEQGVPVMYFSLEADGMVGQLSVAKEDIVMFNGTNFTIYFDGSDVGLAGWNVDGLAIVDESTLLLSFAGPESVPGIAETVWDSDIVAFAASSLGEETAGTFSLYFDGSDVGLEDWVDVDGLERLPDGRLLVSTCKSFSVPGVTGEDEDIIAFTVTSLGADTAGSWEMYFDGSDIGLDGLNGDVDGLAVDEAGEMYMSTIGKVYLADVISEDEDVFVCKDATLGWDAACGWYELFFDGSPYGLWSNDLSALEFPPAPPASQPPTVSIVSPGEGSVVAGTVTVQIEAVDAEDELGTLTVEWRVDGGVWQAATYNASSGRYEETWDTTLEGEGMHVVHARATDSTAETGETSNSVQVDNVNEAPMAVFTYNCPDMTCDFDGSGSTDIDGTIESYSWDFGDSNTASGVMASHTYDSGGTYTVVLTVTDDGDATGTDSQSVSVTEQGVPVMYFSLEADGMVGQLSAAKEDIVMFNGTNFTIYFDGSDVGLAGWNVDGLAIVDESTLLLSFAGPESVPGIAETVWDSDIVAFAASSLGEETAGTFSLYFDGSDVGLEDWVDVDGLERLPDGRLLVSTCKSFSVPGVTGEDEDIIAFTVTSLGADTAGSWEMYFDGSDIGLDGLNGDVDGLAVDEAGEMYMSTIGKVYLADVISEDEDVFVCKDATLGWDAACGWYELFFDGSPYGLWSNDLSALEFPPAPPASQPPTVSIVSPGEGSVVAGTVTVQIEAVDAEDELGTLTVEWRVDGGVWQAATYNASSGRYEETWDTTLEGEGMHVVHARATDSTAETGETSNSVQVDNVNEAPMAVFTYNCPDMTCDFDGSGSTDIDGTIESYSWDFGDSNTASGVMASHTYDSGGTYTVVLTVTDDGDATGTDSQSVSVTEQGVPVMYFSLEADGMVGQLSAAKEDIVMFNGTNFTIYFDGSDVGLAGWNVDGLAIVDESTLLLSFAGPESVPGIAETVWDSDIVAFAASSLGEETAGTFSLYFDGSDVGLEDWVDVDGLERLPDGRLLVSTCKSFSVPGVTGEDEDIIAFTVTSLGADTAGSWEMYFDGSDIGLDGRNGDVDGLAVDEAGEMYMSTIGKVYLADVISEDEDVFVCKDATLGWDAACGWYELFFDGSPYGLWANDLSALELP